MKHQESIMITLYWNNHQCKPENTSTTDEGGHHLYELLDGAAQPTQPTPLIEAPMERWLILFYCHQSRGLEFNTQSLLPLLRIECAGQLRI